jgi:multiple antibiotic resistance protein
MTATAAFLLAFPALFSIVNPVGGAFIFHEVTAAWSHAERVRVAGRIGLYGLAVMLGALWAGAYILNFFGISLGALRIAGGSVVALRAWEMLMSPERQETRKQAQASEERSSLLDMAFFPLTMPFTTGPGTIAVAISLGAERPASGLGLVGFFLGVSAAALAIALLIWLGYRSTDLIVGRMGVSARRSLSRLMAFLLLCIGVQIMVSGFDDALLTVLRELPRP